MTGLWHVSETEAGSAIAHGRSLVDELHFQNQRVCGEAVAALTKAGASLIDFRDWLEFDPSAGESPASSFAWFLSFRLQRAGLSEVPGLTRLSATWLPLERQARFGTKFDLALIGWHGVIGAAGITVRSREQAEQMTDLLNCAGVSGAEFTRRCFHSGAVTLAHIEAFTAQRIEARP